MSNDQQTKSREPSGSVAGSGSGSGSGSGGRGGGGGATTISLSFFAHHQDGGHRFWPPQPESGRYLDDRHEGELRALELLQHYRDSKRTAAPLLRRILGDALADGVVDMPPHLDGFLHVIDDLLRLAVRAVNLDDYGRALALQQQAERADERRRHPDGKPE